MSALQLAMAEVAHAVETELERRLPAPSVEAAGGPEARLLEAMRYAALGPGKRFRPFLVVAGARLFDVPDVGAMPAAIAVEMVHAYSLVHDDLPAMDDDDLQRAGGAQCALGIGAEQAGAFDQQKRPQTLAAAKAGIAHGLDQPVRADSFAFARLRRQQSVEQSFDLVRDLHQSLGKIVFYVLRHVGSSGQIAADLGLPDPLERVKTRLGKTCRGYIPILSSASTAIRGSRP
jgi:hypothetical protein